MCELCYCVTCQIGQKISGLGAACMGFMYGLSKFKSRRNYRDDPRPKLAQNFFGWSA